MLSCPPAKQPSPCRPVMKKENGGSRRVASLTLPGAAAYLLGTGKWPTPGKGRDFVTLKRQINFWLISFALFALFVYLFSPILLPFVAGMALVAIALGCWAFGLMAGPGKTGRQTLTGLAVGLAIPLVAANWLVDLEMDSTPVCDDGSVAVEMSFEESVPWQAFTEERVAALKGKTVFIDFTADWCLTCKANEKAILETKPVRDAMRDNGVVPLKADWTKRDPVITEWLRRYKRAGVPFYLVLPADETAAPIALPEVRLSAWSCSCSPRVVPSFHRCVFLRRSAITSTPCVPRSRQPRWR